jgi:cell filamentation protein
MITPRYSTSHLPEAQFEPGSSNRVLKNNLGITSPDEMDKLERESLLLAMEIVAGLFGSDHRFNAADICKIHKTWLGGIYAWAGDYRQVNVSKGDFTFAMARHIPTLMQGFEKGVLHDFTPCRFESYEKLAEAIAIVHAELLLIHPFREGNGRVARMLAALMAMQAGLPPLDFRAMTGRGNNDYIKAVQAGAARDYAPMKKIFKAVIRNSLRARERR